MLSSIRFKKFRAFEDFTISFEKGCFLVGPNNAGKTTILTSLRFVDVFIRYALTKKPQLRVSHNAMSLWAYPINLVDYPALAESIHHEFEPYEASIEVKWTNKCKLVAVWPADDEPYFYLLDSNGLQPTRPVKVASIFEPLGIIPVLSPIEHAEKVLGEDYVRHSLTTRLSSRHFRNQLYLMKENGDLDRFIEFAKEWLGDVKLEEIVRRITEDGPYLDVYFKEEGSRISKELTWAGDGLQIWLQLLFHIYRSLNHDTVILDEPDIYLHADLQRKLIRLLESLDSQVILATHSSEIINEASPNKIAIVDKTKRHAIRVKDELRLDMLTTLIGSAFNLRLAQALRSSNVLFVEGDDMKILKRLGRTLGLLHIPAEKDIIVLPLKGFSNKQHVEPFAWLNNNVLTQTLKLFVILDNDYRTSQTREATEAEFRNEGISLHIWQRKEIENYLLNPKLIARLASLNETTIITMLDEVCETLKTDTFGNTFKEELKASEKGIDISTVSSDLLRKFEQDWKDKTYRLSAVSGKAVIAMLNQRLSKMGLKTISGMQLASSIKVDELPAELVEALNNIESNLKI